MMKSKVIVIGFGMMGRTHIKQVLNHPCLELSAIVNRTIDLEYAYNKKENSNLVKLDLEVLKKVPVFNNLEECLIEICPDIAIITLPTYLHCKTAELCLGHGAHVLCEKPFSLDCDEAAKIIALAKNKNRILMIAHCMRFAPPCIRLKEIFDSGRLGKLSLLKLRRISGMPGWGSWTDEKVQDTWGGALFDLLIHDIDYANHLLGPPDVINAPKELIETFGNRYVCSTWQYSDGTIVLLEGGNCFPVSFEFENNFTAKFEYGTVYWSNKNPQELNLYNDDGLEKLDLSGMACAQASQINYFTDCVMKNISPVKCLPEDSLMAVKICKQHLRCRKIERY